MVGTAALHRYPQPYFKSVLFFPCSVPLTMRVVMALFDDRVVRGEVSEGIAEAFTAEVDRESEGVLKSGSDKDGIVMRWREWCFDVASKRVSSLGFGDGHTAEVAFDSGGFHSLLLPS